MESSPHHFPPPSQHLEASTTRQIPRRNIYYRMENRWIHRWHEGQNPREEANTREGDTFSFGYWKMKLDKPFWISNLILILSVMQFSSHRPFAVEEENAALSWIQRNHNLIPDGDFSSNIELLSAIIIIIIMMPNVGVTRVETEWGQFFQNILDWLTCVFILSQNIESWNGGEQRKQIQ